ncbi:MAG: PAS domain S-box protein, partial [Bacteroidales bacterium]
MPDEVKIKYPILDHIEVPEQILKSWQITVDLLAKIAKIPSALIMRVHEQEIEVFVSSLSAGNVYHQGEKAPLDFGLYCETVMSIQHELLIPNALKDPLWDKNPDIKLGMISYCGLPLTWPGGKIFGTICILDHQENAYSHEIRGLLEQFRDSVQFSLEAIYNSSVERNQAKEVAKEQYSTLRSAIDSADAHIFSLDRQYRYTNFNKGHAAVMKAIYGAEIEIGRSLFDYQTVPEDREKAKRNIDRALAGEQFVEASYSGEEKLTRLYFEISHNPIIAEDGTVIGVVVFSQDITGRKQTEDEMHRNIVLSEQSRKTMLSILEDQKRSEDLIRKSEEKYRTLLQTAMDGFWMTDGKGKLLQVNDAYCRMSGYTEQELLTMHINDLDSAETAAATAAHIKGIITKGEDRFETKHCKKDGSLFDVEVNVQFKDFEGGRFIVFLQDITQRKLAEEELKKLNQKYEKILTSVGDGIYGTDIDGNILFVNPSAARMLGYETQEMIGKNSHTLFHHTKADGSPYIADECPLHKTIVKGGIHRGEDEIFWTMDGASFDVEHVNTPLIENGKVVGAVVIFKDITQRKRTEEALKKYLEKYQVFFDM